jgi:hypothetical protein
VQVFTDADNLLDQANKYHLFVIEKAPAGLNLIDPPKKRRLLV